MPINTVVSASLAENRAQFRYLAAVDRTAGHSKESRATIESDVHNDPTVTFQAVSDGDETRKGRGKQTMLAEIHRAIVGGSD